MHLSHPRKIAFGLSLVLLILAAAIAGQQVYARSVARPDAQVSPLHPTFILLDKAGENVQESNAPISTVQTCGQCHDTAFITSHSFHADLGMSEQFAAGQAPGSRPWDTSTGLYGKWNPLSYRYLSPSGDARTDLDNVGWVEFFAERVVGGGPGEAAGVEMNCFLCHLEQPNNAARIQAIRAGNAAWANTATLLGTGVVEQAGDGFAWKAEAFNAAGELDVPYVTIQDPSNANCAQCHGLVHTNPEESLILDDCSLDNWQTATTGQVVSAQKISLSGMNLANKDNLTRTWDVHAERGLKCTDCHFSLNNPTHTLGNADNQPVHLQYDPRRLEFGEYLQKPDHNLARGQSAQYTIAPELKGTMRRCESCHEAKMHGDWLPYLDRHMQVLACETCHIPQMYAPAVQSYDWTVLQASGEPSSACRGVDGAGGTLNDLVTGFQPILMQRGNIDGGTMLAPYNLVTAWYWVYDNQDGTRPVRLEDLRAAWLEGDGYAPQVLHAFDADQNGQLSPTELRLDTPEKQTLIAERLAALGLKDPRIAGEIQPYSINHNLARGEWALRDCQVCHSDDSRMAGAMKLADYLPGGVMPAFVKDTNIQAFSDLSLQDGSLYYVPSTSDLDLYVFGHNRVSWIDWFGATLFVGVLLGVVGHGSLRLYRTIRQPRHQPGLKRVYMYAVYERFWHWLQTFVIGLLLVTGLIIHRPDIFGWLSFRHMVTLHNVLAAILVINATLSLFYHLVSGEIQQFIPRPYGFFDQAILQAKFYLRGIFKGDAHPFEKTPSKKLNPLQQATYFGILNVLLPLQVLTGALMWGVQRWPDIARLFGGLPFLAPFHSLVAWTFGAFIIGHVYLTTTGYEPMAGIRAMINGWEDVETFEAIDEGEPSAPETSSAGSEQPQTVAAD